MATIKSYMEGKELRFRVSIGRKTLKGFHKPSEALRAGIDAVALEDPRAAELLDGKPFERQVGIIYGPEVRDQYCVNV